MPGQPRWLEIAEDLQERIEQNEFPRDGDSGRQQLPKELDLRREYNVSRNTVRDALGYLAERGIVESEQGKGTFVIPRPAPFHVTLSVRDGAAGGEGAAYRLEAQVQNRKPIDSEVKVEIQPAIQIVAHYLQVPHRSQVISRHQERYIDDSPWSLQTSFYPLDFVHRGALRLLETVTFEGGTVKYLEETLGYKQAGYHDEIRARHPDSDEIAFFNLPERAAVLVYETCRTAYDREGRPFRVTVTVWPSDRNRLHYNIGTVPQAVVERPGEPYQLNDART